MPWKRERRRISFRTGTIFSQLKLFWSSCDGHTIDDVIGLVLVRVLGIVLASSPGPFPVFQCSCCTLHAYALHVNAACMHAH